MNDTAVLQKVETLTKTVERLQQRVEDLEDLRDLQAAIAENGQEPLIPWEQAKAELDLDLPRPVERPFVINAIFNQRKNFGASSLTPRF